jgi:4,5-DOPA dioxygenase extradiol
MKARIIYFSHGGGPLPILGDPGHKAMVDFMRELPSKLRKPDAILVISAHWEESVPTILGAARPELFYDYYGFPKESYEIISPAPGSPATAGRIVDLLGKSGIPSRIDAERGYDHGHFIPLKLMNPE